MASFDISLQFSGVSRLFLISSIIYSLKDAAEQNRLGSTTSISMNYMVAAWASIVGIGQAIIPRGLQLRNAEFFAVSAMFFLKGFKEHKKRWDTGESSDETEEDDDQVTGY
jgi:hypothetical protein